MLNLIHTTEEAHYEAYRAQQMETRKFGEARPESLTTPSLRKRKRISESDSQSRLRLKSTGSDMGAEAHQRA